MNTEAEDEGVNRVGGGNNGRPVLIIVQRALVFDASS
jgi:hypothetical protein